MIVPVVFRKWGPDNGNGVVALMPTLAATADGYYCDSYERVGGYGAADYHTVVRLTRPATEGEYGPLLAEMRRLYEKVELRVCRRAARTHHDQRSQDAANYRRRASRATAQGQTAG
jgi:hypothetical protein